MAANGSALVADGWVNGSLANQFTNVPFANLTAQMLALRQNPPEVTNLNLTILNDHIASLTFDTQKTDLITIAGTVDNLFRTDVFSFSQACAYPISGQYDFLARLLFYVLLIASLVLRHHLWLSTAALGTAMTYGGVSALHALALIARFGYSDDQLGPDTPLTDAIKKAGDVDLAGIYPVLAAGCLMLTPILNFSKTVRDHNGRAVVLVWGMLMFTALIATLAKIWNNQGPVVPYMDLSQLTTCRLNVSKSCTAFDALISNNTYGISNFASYEFYHRCECNDTCGAVSPENVAFRKDTGMQAWLTKDRTSKLLQKDAVWIVYTLIVVALTVEFGLGVLSIIESKWDQKSVRNWVYRTLGPRPVHVEQKTTFHQASETNGRPSPFASIFTLFLKLHKFMAKCVAAGLYSVAILNAILAPMLFIASVIINEFITHYYPVSETEDAIGQWGAWVGAGLVLGAAIIQNYHAAWVRSIRATYATVYRVMKGIRNGNGVVRLEKAKRTQENSVKKNLIAFFRQCTRPFVHVWKALVKAWGQIAFDSKEFRDWWKDPDLHNTSDSDPRTDHGPNLPTHTTYSNDPNHGLLER